MILPEILQVNLNNYTLGSSFRRKNLMNGGVSIFVRNSLKFNQTHIMHLCIEQDIECCATQLESKFRNIYVLATHKAQTGDFEQRLNKLVCIINYLYKPKAEFIIGADINTDFLTKSHCKLCLISLLT
jgi:hypothetical protein